MTDSVNQQAEQNGTGTDGPPPPPLLRSASSGLKRNRGCFLIGIAGGTASGKTTVCHRIMDRLQDQCARLIHQDSYYRGLTPEEHINVRRECSSAPAVLLLSQHRLMYHNLLFSPLIYKYTTSRWSEGTCCSYQKPWLRCCAPAAAEESPCQLCMHPSSQQLLNKFLPRNLTSTYNVSTHHSGQLECLSLLAPRHLCEDPLVMPQLTLHPPVLCLASVCCAVLCRAVLCRRLQL
jgi:hypothetical protein